MVRGELSGANKRRRPTSAIQVGEAYDSLRLGSRRDAAVIRVLVSAGQYSGLAAIGTGPVLLRQYGGQLTMAASSNSAADSCVGELTLSTRYCRSQS